MASNELEVRRHLRVLREMSDNWSNRAQRALDAPGSKNYKFYKERQEACDWALREYKKS